MTSWDAALFRMINEGLGSKWLDPIMIALSATVLWVLVGAAVLLLALARSQKIVVRLLVLASLSIGVSDFVAFRVLKPLIDRERPCYQLENVRLVADSCGSRVSFPSNHAANSMAAAVSSILLLRKLKTLWLFLIPLAVGVSRVYLGVHFPGDVAAGFLFGGAVGVASYSLWLPVERSIDRWHQRRPQITPLADE